MNASIASAVSTPETRNAFSCAFTSGRNSWTLSAPWGSTAIRYASAATISAAASHANKAATRPARASHSSCACRSSTAYSWPTPRGAAPTEGVSVPSTRAG